MILIPIPEPRPNENKNSFIERCMEDEVMKEEFDEEQRIAVCEVQWYESVK